MGGPFKDYNDVDPGINQVLIHSNNGPYYLVKLDPYGNYVWHKQYGDGSATFNGISLTADANANLYLGGYFEGTTDFDLGPDTTNLTSTPWTESAFITKLDMNGNYQWAKHYPDQNAPSRITSVTIDSFSNVYISGQFSGSIDFDPDSATYLLTHNYGAQFISKLTNNGKFTWANMIGSAPNYSGGPWFTQLTTDIFGTVYFGGTFTHTVDFDPSPSVFNLGINSGIDNLFIMKLNAAGDFSWAKSFEGYYDHKYLNDLHLGYDGQIYATGSFKDSIDFGQINAQPTMLHSLGDYDAFNLKVRECSVLGPRQNISECDSFLWPVDSSLYAQSGTYLSVLKGNGGCDSIIIMDLTINNIDITVTTHGHTLVANDSSANYQWLSCDSNFIAISGDTSQSFIPAQNGTYAVALEKGGCIDTSICYLVNSVDLNSELAEPTIAVYPNPFQKGISISNLPHNGCSELLITDLAGHLLIRQAGPTEGEHYLDLNTLPLGI